MKLPHHVKSICVPTLHQITVPNKHVQSYFLKTDASYYTRERYKMKNYCLEADRVVTVCISNTHLHVHTHEPIALDGFFENLAINAKYTTVTAAMDYLGSLCFGLVEHMKEAFFGVAFVDWLNRAEVIGMVNLFLLGLQVKGIFLVPYSLAIAISRGLSSAIVVHVYDSFYSVALIDDSCMVEKHRFNVELRGIVTKDEEDFVEEFTRRPNENREQVYCCKICRAAECYDKMVEHLEKVHLIEKGEDDYAIRGSIEEAERTVDAPSDFISYVKKQVEAINADKNKKAYNIVLCNQTSRNPDAFGCAKAVVEDSIVLEEGSTIQECDECDKRAMEGAALLSTLDVCKDFWLTDGEWQDFGLRILKEKVLFHV